MAEIKSTLDIIMEKTKNLTMTHEEKRAFKQQEMEGKIKGLIVKFADGVLDEDRLSIEMAALQEKDKAMVDAIIREESIDLITIEEENEPILGILESIIGMDTTPLREMMSNFKRRLSQEKEARRKAVTERLKKRGISGSAVLPNLEADPDWRNDLSEMERTFKEQIKRLL